MVTCTYQDDREAAPMVAETLEAECRNGHRHAYRPPAGRSVKCRTSECRVSLWLPKNATPEIPVTASEWAGEGPPGYLLPGGQPYPVACPTCGTGRIWEHRRTLVYCPECDQLSIPAFVTDRARQRDDNGDGAGGAGEVAHHQDDDDAALHLAETRGIMLHSLRGVLDDDRLRVDSRARLEWYAAEIGRAGTMNRLAELAERLRGERIRRVGWFSPDLPVAELVSGEQDDDDADEWDDEQQWDDDDDDQEPPAVVSVAALPTLDYTAAIRANGFYDVTPNAPAGHCQITNRRSGTTGDPLNPPQPCGGGAFRQFGPYRLCPSHFDQFVR